MFKNFNKNLVNKPFHRINRRIQSLEIRLVENDQNLGIVKTSEALKRAEFLGVDLIEIAPQAKPPVCVLMDYGKFRYEQQQKEKEKNKKQKGQETKELIFKPSIEAHDIEVKVKSLKKFLLDGKKVLVVVKFKGRQLAHKDVGAALIKKIQEMAADAGDAERSPSYSDKSISVVFAPKPGLKETGQE